MTARIPQSRHVRGMSLVEILVTIFVLAVGLLAVVRVLIPGLSALPRVESRSKGSVLAQGIARAVESRPEYRPDSIEHAVRIDPESPNSGWTLHQDISMGDLDQISPTLTSNAGGTLTPLYPNLVIGERFDTPLSGQVYLVQSGPYVAGTLRVYYPEPYLQVEPGFENEPGTFSVTANMITFGPGAASDQAFMACFSTITAAGIVNIVGEVLPDAGNAVLSAAPIPYSVCLYVLAPGISEIPAAGAVRAEGGAPPAGTSLACTYEIQPHVRAGYEESMLTRFPKKAELRNVPVPDILSYDTVVPVNDPRTVTLPFRTLAGRGQDGAPIPLDANGPENIRAVNKVTGETYTPGSGIVDDGADPSDSIAALGGFVTFDTSGPVPGTPVRIYYRVAGNWSVEQHVAPAYYSMYDPGAQSFVPNASRGLKQNWYTLWVGDIDGEPYTTLVFHNIPGPAGPIAARSEDFWRGGPLLNTRSDGHRVAVDYRYAIDDPNAPDGQLIERVTGETHLVDFTTHAFTLNHPRVVQIDGVRGISYKVRACFDDNTGRRSRVDVDTLAMR